MKTKIQLALVVALGSILFMTSCAESKAPEETKTEMQQPMESSSEAPAVITDSTITDSGGVKPGTNTTIKK